MVRGPERNEAVTQWLLFFSTWATLLLFGVLICLIILTVNVSHVTVCDRRGSCAIRSEPTTVPHAKKPRS